MVAYPWSSSGFGTIYADPATAYTTTGYGISFTAAGTDLGIAIDGSPYGVIYPWTNASGYGTKYTDPQLCRNHKVEA